MAGAMGRDQLRKIPAMAVNTMLGKVQGTGSPFAEAAMERRSHTERYGCPGWAATWGALQRDSQNNAITERNSGAFEKGYDCISTS